MKVADARRRVVLEKLSPEVDAGRFPVKRCVGEAVRVEVDMFADGHDALGGVVRFRHEADPVDAWTEVALRPVVNDRWYACFQVSRPGSYRYSVTGWIAPFESWRRGLEKKAAAGLDLTSDLEIGAAMLE